MSNQQVGICIGHSRKIDGHPEGGAVSVGDVSEWDYNRELAEMIVDELARYQIDSLTVSEYQGDSYGAAQRWLAGFLEECGVTVAIELHFNSSDSVTANGHEMLYWHSSKRGKELANDLSIEFCLGVPELKSRGIKPRDATHRGAQFLRGTHCPAVIVESFFGSSPGDWWLAVNEKSRIARAIAEGIASFLD